MENTSLTLILLALLSACSSQQSTSAQTSSQDSETIVLGQLIIRTADKRAATRFDKPACELNFVFINGLEKITRLNVTNLETIANNEPTGLGFTTPSIQPMSTLVWPEKLNGACDALGDMTFREVFCDVVNDQGSKVGDCRNELIFESGEEVKIVDKRNL